MINRKLRIRKNSGQDKLDDWDYFLKADPRLYRFLLDPANLYGNIPIDKLKEHVRMMNG